MKGHEEEILDAVERMSESQQIVGLGSFPSVTLSVVLFL
jgi:hypothetical protein